MKTIKDSTEIVIKVKMSDLIESRWITFPLLSKKITEIEKEKELYDKKLRIRFYNSFSHGKFNSSVISGIKCVDALKPMAEEKSSLVLRFVIK